MKLATARWAFSFLGLIFQNNSIQHILAIQFALCFSLICQ